MKANQSGKEIKAPRGFDVYQDVMQEYSKTLNNWDNVGKTDLYSTGLEVMDEYLCGGFGQRGQGEIVLIHSASKCFKSTLSMQLVRDPLERGVKMGWIILEGGMFRAFRNLRQTYAQEGYEKCDAILKANQQNIFSMSEEMQYSEFSMDNVISWMKYLYATKGVQFFLIDPIGYLSDYSSDWGTPDYKKESKFMKNLVQFADQTCSTVICLQHNTKGNDFDDKHRESAIGGSQSFSKSPTKVIEIRREGLLAPEDPSKGRLMSMEFYMGRDVMDKRGYPLLFNVQFHPDGKGKFFSVPKYDTQEDADASLSGGRGRKDGRHVWWGQVEPEVRF